MTFSKANFRASVYQTVVSILIINSLDARSSLIPSTVRSVSVKNNIEYPALHRLLYDLVLPHKPRILAHAAPLIGPLTCGYLAPQGYIQARSGPVLKQSLLHPRGFRVLETLISPQCDTLNSPSFPPRIPPSIFDHFHQTICSVTPLWSPLSSSPV